MQWLARHLGQERPKSMSALTAMMTRFYAGEDNWLARRSNSANDPGTSEVRGGNGKPRRNKNKHLNNNEGTRDTTINAGFSGPRPGQRKKPFMAYRDGPSNLDKILDRPCQIHGHPNNPANHTNRSCWVFKQVGKLNVEHKGKRPPGDSGGEETHQPNTGGQKQFPPEEKTVNMVYVTYIPRGECTKNSPRTEDHTTDISAELQSDLISRHTSSAIAPPVSVQHDRSMSILG